MSEDNLEALLGLSVEVVETMNAAAAMERHPSGDDKTPLETAALTAQDICDDSCSAGALYLLQKRLGALSVDELNRVSRSGSELAAPRLQFCGHHWRRHAPAMGDDWVIIGTNLEAIREMSADRLKGADHA